MRSCAWVALICVNGADKPPLAVATAQPPKTGRSQAGRKPPTGFDASGSDGLSGTAQSDILRMFWGRRIERAQVGGLQRPSIVGAFCRLRWEVAH